MKSAYYNYRFFATSSQLNAQWTLFLDYATKSYFLSIDESGSWHCRWAAGHEPEDKDWNWHTLFHQNCGKMIHCNKKRSEQEFQQRRFCSPLELQALWSSTEELASDSQTSLFIQHWKHKWYTNNNSIKTHFTFKVSMRAEQTMLIFLIHIIGLIGPLFIIQSTTKIKGHTTYFSCSINPITWKYVTIWSQLHTSKYLTFSLQLSH